MSKTIKNKQMSSKPGVNVSPKGNHMFGKSTVKTATPSAGAPGAKSMVGFTGVKASKKL